MPNTTRNYFPHTEAQQLDWARNFVGEINTFAVRLGVTTVADMQQSLQMVDNTINWQQNAHDLARERTKDKHAAMWNKVGEKYDIIKNNTATNPAPPSGGAQITFNPGGLFPLIFAAIDKFIHNPAICTPDIMTVLRLNPLPKHDPALEDLISDLRAEFTGGEVLLRMTKPFPADAVQLAVDRHNGKGEVPVTTVFHAKYTDHHDLPEARATWDYSARLLDKNGTPIGRKAYAAVTVKAGGL